MLALLLHPDQFARLRSDPALLPSAVEELLRFCAPVATSTIRYAAEDVTLGGNVIPKGDMVLVVVMAANRHPPVRQARAAYCAARRTPRRDR
jgi:cytochrome P450